MSVIDQILGPIFQLIGPMLAFFYGLVPNYAVAIILLTVAVMAAMSPLVVKSTRSMIQLQRLAPELKKIQQKYKGDRQRQNEEVMAFYKANHVNPAGGCLPMFLQLPVFFVLYGVLGGMVHTTGGKHPKLDPLYIPHNSALYSSLIHGHGKLMSFGLDLSNKALGAHSSVLAAMPFWTIVIVAIGLQYFQMRQLSGRSPQMAEMNPQMQAMQKYMPLIFGFIYLNISAGVNIYFIVSSVWRIWLQGLLFRFDPAIRSQPGELSDVEQGAAKQWNLVERLLSLGSGGSRQTNGSQPASLDGKTIGANGAEPRNRPAGSGSRAHSVDKVETGQAIEGVARGRSRSATGDDDLGTAKPAGGVSRGTGSARPGPKSAGRSDGGSRGRDPGGSPSSEAPAAPGSKANKKTGGPGKRPGMSSGENARRPGTKKLPPAGSGGGKRGTK